MKNGVSSEEKATSSLAEAGTAVAPSAAEAVTGAQVEITMLLDAVLADV